MLDMVGSYQWLYTISVTSACTHVLVADGDMSTSACKHCTVRIDQHYLKNVLSAFLALVKLACIAPLCVMWFINAQCT